MQIFLSFLFFPTRFPTKPTEGGQTEKNKTKRGGGKRLSPQKKEREKNPEDALFPGAEAGPGGGGKWFRSGHVPSLWREEPFFFRRRRVGSCVQRLDEKVAVKAAGSRREEPRSRNSFSEISLLNPKKKNWLQHTDRPSGR